MDIHNPASLLGFLPSPAQPTGHEPRWTPMATAEMTVAPGGGSFRDLLSLRAGRGEGEGCSGGQGEAAPFLP